MTDYKEFLDIAVNQENKPVTYKLLARSLGIHVQNAKQALQEYSKSNNNLHVIYCIMGQSLNNDMCIQLVKEEDLEEIKKKFKKITNMYIYSISSYSLDNLSMLYIANKDIPKLSLEDRVKCGILKYPVKYNKPAAKDLQPPPPPAKTNVPLSKQPVIATHSATKRKAIFPPDSSAAPSSPLKKVAIEKTSKNTTTKATGSSKSKKNEKQVKTTPPKKTGSEEADLEKRMAKTSLKVEDIFSDDDQEEEPQQQEQEQQQQQDEEDVVMFEADEDNKEKAEEEHEDEEAIPAEPGKIRRKVLKKKTTTNARGLLVTEEVWEWETVDAPQEEVTKKKTPKPTKSAKSAPTTNKPPASKKMGQSSLLSFFGKKP
ncbi:hypothetical protein BCV72DRAFT_309095 [Rhizopus microsporus var. microsporus]|uniref:DNA polymerase delta subunit 3 n=2 Tax=Rhizopus microsporus TaxID=58291 RepID=A0A2G4SZ87_RHIZD|nr:uncharacterized protein RHIMIDRAFT_236077 [Rhizopus microsporus ATCC 52813]ORE02457.1 hypothetical protein BCV72DRAFT_309095 [Rhizopus microsporus var. microsporus]PHZ14083.1 hypothetical protein RHIMIDRAFT_236077 [Rhizopus microsporus ATCC 52813]